MGQAWVHSALEAPSRFLIDARVGPRTLGLALQLVASVALCCGGSPPLFLIDEHLPYPKALLQVFGVIQFGRRRNGRGRHKLPRLKPPQDLLVGVVEKLRDSTGRLKKVTPRALFGRLRDITAKVQSLKIGQRINTSYIERLNGTLRGQVARLVRRTRNVSHLIERLQWAVWLWRDLYNWTRVHGALEGQTPAMALGLAKEVWTVSAYVTHPVHVSNLQRQQWEDRRNDVLESELDKRKRLQNVPTS